MKKIIVSLILMIFPIISYAKTEVNSIKYYKTTTYYGMYELTKNESEVISTSIEITEGEFNSADLTNRSSTIETTYKKMTAKITSVSNGYKYKGQLFWKKIPKVRSFDIMGIGHNSNITVTNINFNQKYCIGTSCTTNVASTIQTFNNGIGASFQIPSSNIDSLEQNFSFVAQKKNSGTITSQKCVVDYAHATQSVTSSQAQNYTMDLTGLHLDSSIVNKYDTINYASVTWTGSW